MTNSDWHRHPFTTAAVQNLGAVDFHYRNWPVVYTLNNDTQIYVGESLNVAGRMRQHLESADKKPLRELRIIVDETFNKSACLDLESFLIGRLFGDGHYRVLNANNGVTDADYYDRDAYRAKFTAIFNGLRQDGIFQKSAVEIENSELFKFSPFKALNAEQIAAVGGILEKLLDDRKTAIDTTSVVRGDPGTGKTIVAIFLLKLVRDITRSRPDDDLDHDALFAEFFTPESRALLTAARVGFVIPQQSLRTTVQKVFAKTLGLSKDMVLSPFEVGADSEKYDLLVVDEAHRLMLRANQPSAAQNRQFAEITERLFGVDDPSKTQLDWLRAQSRHLVLLVDTAQSVRPADVPTAVLDAEISQARDDQRLFTLISQMRVGAGGGYIDYVRQILSSAPPKERRSFSRDYDIRLFTDLAELRDAVRERDREFGLSRMVAGFAWPWVSRKEPSRPDIRLDGLELFWNRRAVDWINSSTSIEEVGSIHTVQGYDLNYAGVIIGPDLRYDPQMKRLYIDRASYHDARGKENNPKLGLAFNDEDLLKYIANIYAVLMTRGMRGTYVYVCDPALREHLARFL